MKAGGKYSELEFEQFDGVQTTDFQAVCLADAHRVEPVGGVVDVLEGPVGGVQQVVGADFQQRVNQGLGAEIARGG